MSNTDVTGVQSKAAAAIEAAVQAENAKADTPSEAEVLADLTFAEMDMTDAAYWLKENGKEYDPGMAYHWCNSDPRVMPKRKYAGWEPITPTIRRGDLILCHRPKALNDKDKARLARLTKEREKGPFATYENDVQPEVETGNFSTFDGSKGRRDGL